MATTPPKPRNATPKPLLLRPPQVPRMPFNSPMGEEILSPTSDPSHTPPQEQRENGQKRNEKRRKSIGERRSSMTRPTKGDWGEERTDRKWPELNVITDFTRCIDQATGKGEPQVQPLRIAKPKQETSARQASERRKGSQDSLKGRQDPRLGHRRSLKGSGSKGRLDDLKRASSKSPNLSPSDRAVVIGISMGPDEVSQDESPGKEHNLDSAQSGNGRRHSVTPSLAPSIVVTPAKETGHVPWKDQPSPPPRRPSSSIYSHMPAPKEITKCARMVPPVPPLPARAPEYSEPSNDVEGIRPRIASNCTIFDEEPSPDAAAQFRPGSQDSQLHMLGKWSTNDTVATTRRSQGWWNVIKSPFFPKSPMHLKYQQASPDDDMHSVPAPLKLSSPARKRGEASPGSPPRYQKSQVAESAHTSWTDSGIEVECEKRALEFSEPTNAAESLDERPPVSMPRESYYVAAHFEGLGAASEYYEACLYDMHSAMPFFDCQNHKCLPSTLGIGGYVTRGFDGPETPPVLRGMALKESDKSKDGREAAKAGLPVPANRFSAAFGEAVGTPKAKNKHQSEVTVIEDLDATPAIHEAKAAPVLKAPEPVTANTPPIRTLTPPVRNNSLAQPSPTIYSSPFFNKPDPTPKALPPPPPKLPDKDSRQPDIHREMEPGTPGKAWMTGLPSNPRHKTLEHPLSPQPPTPGAQKHAPKCAFPLVEMRETRGPSPERSHPPQNTYIPNHLYGDHSRRASTSTADLRPPTRPPRPAESLGSWHTKERYDPVSPPKKDNRSLDLAKLKACIQRKRRSGQGPRRPMDNKKRRWVIIIIAMALLLLIILILVLAMTLTRGGDKMSAQSQWLNITGYPPVPTGISTIAQPDAAHDESGCVQPTSMWSCAVPKEEQKDIALNAPNQPNFRVEIRFQNGTKATVGNSSSLDRRSTKPVTARLLFRAKILQLRSTFSNTLYASDPRPPSQEDQTFLGNSTDGVNAPFDGEYTPFYMTFHSSAPLPSRLRKRRVLDTDGESSSTSDSDDPNSKDSSSTNSSFPDISAGIPSASTDPDGTASPALLYPYPVAQPLRLYNRGRPDEHYGFYTYFSRSIFLKSTTPLNTSAITGNTRPTEPADRDGGAEGKDASVRCTWTQTRFLVQIWTDKNSTFLLQSNGTIPTSSSSKSHDATQSSASDLTRPGSFPYPITLTIDRHGGDASKKMIYCYGLDNSAKPIAEAKKLQLEDRAFGGALVNPALGPWKDIKVSTKEGGPGGIDGGSGGCGCRWQNWR